jgi:Protein of unknown function (DUF2786)
MTETTAGPSKDTLLSRVRKLLAKAEAEGVTPPEAQALTAKASELMAKYGIDRALLAATKPETDTPGDCVIDVDNPWARIQAHLLCGIAGAMRCQAVLLPRPGAGTRIHLFGFQSDLERADLMYTSLMLQMFSGLRYAEAPEWTRSRRAWSRSWLLGFATAAVSRVKQAEAAARTEAVNPHTESGSQTALVLADRSLVIKNNLAAAYPLTRKTRLTYSGNGYGSGYAKGQQANLGGTGVGGGKHRAIA